MLQWNRISNSTFNITYYPNIDYAKFPFRHINNKISTGILKSGHSPQIVTKIHATKPTEKERFIGQLTCNYQFQHHLNEKHRRRFLNTHKSQYRTLNQKTAKYKSAVSIREKGDYGYEGRLPELNQASD